MTSKHGPLFVSILRTVYIIAPQGSEASFLDFWRQWFSWSSEATWRHVEAKFKKRAPRRSWQGSISYKTSITFSLTRFSREEIALEDGHIFNFKRPVTLTLTSDDLESYIVRFVSSTSIQRYMVHMAPLQMSWTDGRTYGPTDGQTFSPLMLFGYSQKEIT